MHDLSHCQLQILFFFTLQGFSIFSCKKHNQSDFGIVHLVMNMCSLLLHCWKRAFAMTSVFSWQNSVTLCPASFCISRPNLLVIPCISWLPPRIKIISFFFFLLLVLGGLVGLHTVNFSFFSINGRDIDLDYCEVEWLALETPLVILGYHEFM